MFRRIPKTIPMTLFVSVVCSFAYWNSFSAFAAEANTTFQVNVKESLSVSIETPTTWATGNIDTFLRNTVVLTVASNNANGFTASMSAQNSTSLSHSSKANTNINTISASTSRASFPSNRWGYSLKNNVVNDNKTYGETDAGNSSSTYYPITTSAQPNVILKNTANGSLSQSIYFGAKSNIAQASGTYSGTVVINVVSDVIDNNNPITPTDPAQDNNTNAPINEQIGNTGNYRTVYPTTTSTNNVDHTTTKTTNITEYTPPQGATDSTSSNIYDGSMLTTSLAVTASVAAASGIFFFILAKRKKDDDEDEEETA